MIISQLTFSLLLLLLSKLTRLSLIRVIRSDLPRLERGFPLFLCVLLVFCMYTRYFIYTVQYCRRTNLFVPPALAHESTWATMSITPFLRSAISFQVRKRIAVFLREPLPDDFIPPLPQAASASGDVDDVAHGELISTPST